MQESPRMASRGPLEAQTNNIISVIECMMLIKEFEHVAWKCSLIINRWKRHPAMPIMGINIVLQY